MVPAPLRRALYFWALPNFPDRRYLVSEIIPLISQRGVVRVLFVGCGRGNEGYWRLFAQHNVEVWTIDNDPAVARWGAPGHHITGDASALHEMQDLPKFDCIIFNGVLGYGIDGVEAAQHTFISFAQILAPKSLLIIGWNTDATVDPRTLPALREMFEDLQDPSVPARRRFEGSTHVYDFLVRGTTVPIEREAGRHSGSDRP